MGETLYPLAPERQKPWWSNIRAPWLMIAVMIFFTLLEIRGIVSDARLTTEHSRFENCVDDRRVEFFKTFLPWFDDLKFAQVHRNDRGFDYEGFRLQVYAKADKGFKKIERTPCVK